MKKKEMEELPKIPSKPCIKAVDDCLNDKKNSKLANAQRKIFLEFPENKKIENILIKVACINQFDSTNVKYIEKVSDHIFGIDDIDDLLSTGDLSLVEKIATVKVKDDKEIRYYSFATKYFSHHSKKGEYPIYDQYVSKILRHFNNSEYNFMKKFSDNDLRHYDFLNECINKFISHFGLSNYSMREIDKYLWLTGQKCFPPKKKTK